MLPYDPRLRNRARRLRSELTPAERLLWSRLRRRGLGVRFLRQRPIGSYIVDFYAPRPRVVVELDGGQHWEPAEAARDAVRNRALRVLGLRVVRFSNADVMRSLDAVLKVIATALRDADGEGDR